MLSDFITRNRALLLKLVAALLACGVGVTLFALIASEVRTGATMTFDSDILLWINARGNHILDTVFVSLTNLGEATFVAILTVIIAAFLLYKRSYYRALLMLAAVGGADVLNILLKGMFERVRPDLWVHLVEETSFSFPSGHATASSAFALAIIAILWRSKWQPLAIGLGVLYVFVIGFSRLYLGVHYPTDVMAGWAISLAWVSIATGIIYTRAFRTRQRTRAAAQRNDS